ncbi:bifunctional glycosyltransferase family 2/GtrA family protein [Nocardia farcinica]|uniref:bifunctional glycosyltransferase family 2/GtrA family protein n=1 Tax=Nocardia farcinica TaxID=37329 RepID=UPI00189385E6|nr:bifunctional glycosyltransferase family 2/GtrA family protein [Nocardia farcinica]MBF6068827.1 bifunctional glycosyltransferase family 2/GtrA family protein [Nocardia farcinica]MBF6141307.1 bifunctional glycosyltransferase family 2/GtrA family protein [Nocardia farcinica]MBF6421026.1 bifunctional glycosyltransferase family 2/GtrA family protein [Nocardia farcinica]MBF6432515.1 bifunctional glycosyltransferase family 2/GtrA family protein [Nocardia farcinica]MBF6503014.1 bifunctional glycosy
MTETVAVARTAQDIDATGRPPVLDVVIPVYNEEADLGDCVHRLHEYLRGGFPFPARITIADNASTDATLRVAHELAARYPGVRVVHLDAKGRGRALRAVWERSDAQVVAYMDVDLSTDLDALLPLVAPLVSGHSDLAIGTRLDTSSRVVRGPKREIISRCYNLILKASLRAHFSDAQCGFKAVRTAVARQLLPLVEDGEWFFDTELLVLAERAGLRIHEVPVDWIDDPDSRVDIVDTAIKDLRGVWRLARAISTGALPLDELRAAIGREPLVPGVPLGMVGQVVRFAIIGVLSTLAYMLLYLVLQPVAGAQGANFLALLLTAIANTAANRAFTFGVRGPDRVLTHQFQGLLIFGFGLLVTSGSLFALHRWAPAAPVHVELVVLVTANLVATLARFLGLRWVFRNPRAATPIRTGRTGAAR